jgi:phenylacetate-coenzyme A ligase PaaK-like adenylate-forming protein
MTDQPEINIFNIDNFNDTALKIFRYQHENNPVYRKFCDALNTKPNHIKFFRDIPFLPIEFFKTQRVITGSFSPVGYFQSSGTTGLNTSKHYFKHLNNYETSFLKGFRLTFGNIKDYCVLALLPSYLEQKNSSLIYMVDRLIKESHHPDSGFYLYNLDELYEMLNKLEKQNQKTILFGVTFALLDLVERHNFKLNHTIIMETGGMKGRRDELVREELHGILCDGFGVDKIHSEYGMTELFSQAWSRGDGIFNTPPWMRILIRDVNDPLTLIGNGKTGGINVIDLANLDSCSFIATQDLGKMYPDGSFEVLGRYDHSDVRGCNLLIN